MLFISFSRFFFFSLASLIPNEKFHWHLCIYFQVFFFYSLSLPLVSFCFI